MEIKDYPDYLIYEDGRVYSKKRNKFRKTYLNKVGYERVELYKNGIIKKFTIHRLIALHYIPNPDNKPEVDHINQIKTDNRVENLRWATHSENGSNKGIPKNNTSGLQNIRLTIYGTFRIDINRNKTYYSKTCKTEEQAIYYRDLMLSMFPDF